MGVRQEIGAWLFSKEPFLGIRIGRKAIIEPRTIMDGECIKIRSAVEVLLHSHGNPGLDKKLGPSLFLNETVPVNGKEAKIYIDAWATDPGKAEAIYISVGGKSLFVTKDHGEVRQEKGTRRVTNDDKELVDTCRDAVVAVGKKRFGLALPPELADLT